MEEELFDVVVYETDTRTITNITGTAMRRYSGHYNAERRLETMIGRMNEKFDAEIVPTGKYKVGDILKN